MPLRDKIDLVLTYTDNKNLIFTSTFPCQVFREARRIAPSIVYLPRINTWWEVTPETFRATLFSVVYSLPATTPLLVLATAECPFNKLPIAVKELFKQVSGNLCCEYVYAYVYAYVYTYEPV